MGSKSNIQWTDDTDNVIVVKGGGWFCVKYGPGCLNCYAEALNQNSFYGGNGMPYQKRSNMPKLELRRDILAKWARQTKPRKHFVMSMSDLFGEFVPDEWVYEVLDAMLAAPIQTFQILTKRAIRMHYLVKEWCKLRGVESLPPNIWLMVSVETQKTADERISWLLETPACIRGLSVEPLLEQVDLIRYLFSQVVKGEKIVNLRPRVDWVIVGGESGPGARPFDLRWAKYIIDHCQEVGVPVFVKQLGSNALDYVTKHTKGGEIDEWPAELQIRQFPESKGVTIDA